MRRFKNALEELDDRRVKIVYLNAVHVSVFDKDDDWIIKKYMEKNIIYTQLL